MTLPAHVLAYDTTVIDTLPDTLDLDRLGTATCTSGCPPEAAPAVENYKPVITPATTTVAWSLGDLAETSVARTETITYVASVRSTHRNGGASITAGAKIANKAELYYDKTNKIGFEETKIPVPGTFDKTSGPVSAETAVVEPAITLTKEASVAGGAFSASPFTITDGQSVTYRLTVKNTGTSPAYDVSAADKPSSALEQITLASKADLTKEWAAPGDELQWLIPGPLAAGASVVLEYTGKLVPATKLHQNETVENQASVPSYFGASAAERGAGNENFAEQPILYREYTGPSALVEGKVALPEITLEKTTGAEGFPHSAHGEIGQPFKWRVVVKNVSSVPARNLKVTDKLPPNWNYDASSASFTLGGAIEPAAPTGTLKEGLTLTWSTAIELAAGQSTTLTYEATPSVEAASEPGTGEAHPSINSASAAVEDTAGSSGDETGQFTAGPKSAEAILLLPGLIVKKTPLHAEVEAGRPDEFTVTIENAGSGPARNVTVLDTLPAGMTYTTGSATAEPSAGFTETGHTATTVTWEVAKLAAGATVKIKLPVGTESSLQGTHHLLNKVSVSSTEQPTPLEATGEITTRAVAELFATKTVTAPETGPATPGGEVTYRLAVANHGPSVAAAAKLVDVLPSTLSYISGEAGCSADQETNTVTCAAGDLAPGAEASFKINVRVSSAATGTVKNTVDAETTTEDANPEPTAQATVALAPRADLSILKSDLAPGGEVLDGGHATFALLVSNAGPSDAASPVVTDTLPTGLSFVSATGAPCNAEGQARHLLSRRCACGRLEPDDRPDGRRQ